MNKINSYARTIATFGPIGYLPARGTIASLIAMLALWVSAPYIAPYWMPTVMMVTVSICYIIIQHAHMTFTTPDPAEIVLDEVAGYIFALYIFPRTLPWLGAGFIIFRFFDICKPLGIRRIERVPGAAGIILDDLLAGLYTQLILLSCAMGYAIWTGK